MQSPHIDEETKEMLSHPQHKTKNNKHVGEIYYNNQNELIRIVEYYKYQDVTVEWEDGTRREHVQYGHLRAGKCPRPERMQQRERKPSLIKPQPVRIKTTTTPNGKQSRWKISLSEAYPDIAKQWHPQKNFPHTPEQYTPGSSHKACWQCEKGHEWVTTIRERTRGSQCPFCSNHKVLVGYNDLTTTHPNVAKEWHSTKNGTLQPIEFLAGSDQFADMSGKHAFIFEQRIGDTAPAVLIAAIKHHLTNKHAFITYNKCVLMQSIVRRLTEKKLMS